MQKRKLSPDRAEYAPIHHTKESSVRVVVTHTKLIEDLDRYGIPVITKPSREIILGLNGLLLGVARERNLEDIYLLGEMLVLPYPKASRSILKYLMRMLNVEFDFHKFDKYVEDIEKAIEVDCQQLDEESGQLIDKLKFPEISTEEVFKELDEIFRKNKEEKG